jgi:hypothetical protein
MESFGFIAEDNEIAIIAPKKINTKISIKARRVKDATINELQTIETATNRTATAISQSEIALESTETGGIETQTSIKSGGAKVNLNKEETKQIATERRGNIKA